MKKLFFLFLLTSSAAFSQDTLQPKPPLDVITDYACFRESTAARLEIYYALSSDQLTLTPTDSTTGGPGKYLGYVLAYLDLFTADGRPVDSLSKTTAFRVARMDTTNELSEILDFLATPGNYRAYLSVWDMKSGKMGQDTIEITVPDFTDGGLGFSTPQLARLITDKKHQPGASLYKKGGRLIVPNPPATYSLDDPRLYFYAELYGLAPARSELKNFDLEYSILNESGDTLKSSGFHKHPKEEPAALSGSVDLAMLPPGPYSLVLSARDPATGQTASSSKPFLLFPPSIRPPVAEEELAWFPKVTHFLLTNQEKAIYRSSNRTGQLNFINEWWQKRDPTPQTPENEYKFEAYRRLIKMVERFSRSAGAQDGWQTDRGRVLMLYGEPNNIEQSPASPDNLPWQKWEYTRLAAGRQGLFVFVDLRGLGNYELVHSTVSGEKQNPQWENMLSQNLLRR
ncbi:MAG TPA: GWxTD domain-containing protein [candidate division Zixibacteria bacterium]|nr:GWxTD domain-containing protein [candidate division Zixibacteria bacterium]